MANYVRLTFRPHGAKRDRTIWAERPNAQKPLDGRGAFDYPLNINNATWKGSNMPRTAEVSVYQFDELSDRAKERARDWFREVSGNDEWWENTYEDAVTCGNILGIEFDTHPVQLVNGKTRHDPSIWFGDMYCQGGGACFEGTYSYKAGCARAIRRHAPPTYKNRQTREVETSKSNTRLAEIADGLVVLQKRYGYKLTATVKQTGRYSHEYSTDIDVRQETAHGDDVIPEEDEKELKELLRQFMRWIYSQLVEEDQYRNADEQVDDNIRANEYEFTEDGKRPVPLYPALPMSHRKART